MDQGEFLRRLDEINIWRRHGQRAPHKPLLLLLALGRLEQRKERLALYERDIRDRLHDLLRSFGPPRRSYRPEYPFWHLRSDELWEIPDDDLATIKGGSGTSPSDRQLVDLAVRGGLPETVYRLLDGNPELIQRAAQKILDSHFASSLHQPIRDAVGLLGSFGTSEKVKLRRDPRFRSAVLTAYERRCAVCDFDIRLEDDLVALDAAHIRWHAAGGPDDVRNGLALCILHHRTLDRGAIGLERATSGYRLLVSDVVNGQSDAFRHLLRHNGKRVRNPQRNEQSPDPDFVDWHRREVFRGSPRQTGNDALS